MSTKEILYDVSKLSSEEKEALYSNLDRFAFFIDHTTNHNVFQVFWTESMDPEELFVIPANCHRI